MAKRLAFERYLWFHARLKQNRFPKLQDLARAFEISPRQAAREIDFMRTFFQAPIEYCAEQNGYRYTQANFEFPGLWMADEEFLSLLIARQLAAAIPDRDLKRQIDSHLTKICRYAGIDFQRFETRVSLKNVRYYRVRPEIFTAVVRALSGGLKLRIAYRSIHTGVRSERTVSPLHLLLYMGNWHLLAYCESRQGIRNFVLSRIKTIKATGEPIEPELAATDMRPHIEESYGIFLSGPALEIKLRFKAVAAPSIMEQIWFPGQTVGQNDDGSIDLQFPANDLREVLRDILPFGADVEVIAPAELRQRAAETARRMAGLYEKNG
jgi:predicted DNA-binding transcriptional regulator YafY